MRGWFVMHDLYMRQKKVFDSDRISINLFWAATVTNDAFKLQILPFFHSVFFSVVKREKYFLSNLIAILHSDGSIRYVSWFSESWFEWTFLVNASFKIFLRFDYYMHYNQISDKIKKRQHGEDKKTRTTGSEKKIEFNG